MLHIHTVLCSLVRGVPVPSGQRSCAKDARAQSIKLILLLTGEGMASAVGFTCLLNEKRKELVN